MNIIISGANGFIGAALSKKLPGYTVYNLGHSKRFSKKGMFINLDLTSKSHVTALIEAIESSPIDIFFHFAAQTPYSTQKQAVSLTKELAMARQIQRICSSLSVQRFIFASGWVVYDQAAQTPIDESASIAPNTTYGTIKARLEDYYLNNLKGTQVIVLRIASVYGPGQTSSGLIPSLVGSALKTRRMLVSTKIVKRDYIFIDDLINILVKFTQMKLKSNMILNIGSGKSTGIDNVANTIKVLLLKYFKLTTIIDLSNTLPVGAPKDNLLDITRAKKLLGLKKSKDLKKGLHAYIKWYKENNNL